MRHMLLFYYTNVLLYREINVSSAQITLWTLCIWWLEIAPISSSFMHIFLDNSLFSHFQLDQHIILTSIRQGWYRPSQNEMQGDICWGFWGRLSSLHWTWWWGLEVPEASCSCVCSGLLRKAEQGMERNPPYKHIASDLTWNGTHS